MNLEVTTEKKLNQFLDFINSLQLSSQTIQDVAFFLFKEVKKWENLISIGFFFNTQKEIKFFHFKNDAFKIYALDSTSFNKSSDFRMFLEDVVQYPLAFLHSWQSNDENIFAFAESRNAQFTDVQLEIYLSEVVPVVTRMFSSLITDFDEVVNLNENSNQQVHQTQNAEQKIEEYMDQWNLNIEGLTQDFESEYYKSLNEINNQIVFFKENDFYKKNHFEDLFAQLQNNSNELFYNLIRIQNFKNYENTKVLAQDCFDLFLSFLSISEENLKIFKDIKQSELFFNSKDIWFVLYQWFSVLILLNKNELLKIYSFEQKDEYKIHFESEALKNYSLLEKLSLKNITLEDIEAEIDMRLYLIQSVLNSVNINFKQTTNGTCITFKLFK